MHQHFFWLGLLHPTRLTWPGEVGTRINLPSAPKGRLRRTAARGKGFRMRISNTAVHDGASRNL